MDMLERLLRHDEWTSRLLLARCQALSDARLDQPFDAGAGSVRATLVHTVSNLEVWTALMSGEPVPEHGRLSDPPPTVLELTARYDRAAVAFRTLAEQIAANGLLDQHWIDHLDKPPREKTYGGAIAHVLTHDHFHRAELLHMLSRLGPTDLPEGDVLSWEQSERAGSA